MKHLFYTFSALIILATQSSCLPVLMDENLRTLPAASNVNQIFNKKENLQFYGEQEIKWISNSRNFLYAGIRTPIRVKIPKGMTLKSTFGKIERDKVETDLYYITVDYGMLTVTLYYLDELRENDNKLSPQNPIGDFQILHLPEPKIRLPIPLSNKARATVNDFKQLDYFELISNTIGVDNLEIHCPCTSFTLMRIDKEGKRFSAHSATGDFTKEIKELLAQTQSKDIFIFQNINTSCGPTDLKRTLAYYTVEID